VNNVKPTLKTQFHLCLHLQAAAIVGQTITKGKKTCSIKANTQFSVLIDS